MVIEIKDILSKKILSEAKGYLDIGFTHSLNPYSGCAFSCQPIERKAALTRRILEVMIETPPDLLQIQTRSPPGWLDGEAFRATRDASIVRSAWVV